MRWLLLPLVLLSLTAHSSDKTSPRIIALAPHIVEVLYALEAGDQIIATTDHADYPEAARQIPRIGNYAALQVEKILKLNPDVVITWRRGNPSQDLDRLEQLGIKLVDSSPTQPLEVADEIERLGRISGNQERGRAMAEHFRQRFKQLTSRYQDARPLTLFYELWSRPLTTVAQNAWPHKLVRHCGVVNPFADGMNDYPQVNLEQVMASQPQVIVQPQSVNEPQKGAIDWQQWPQLPAVKHQAVLHPNADLLHRMTPRMLDELSKLCRAIDEVRQRYPDQ